MPPAVQRMRKMKGVRGKDKEREKNKERGQERDGKPQVCKDRMVRLGMTEQA